MSTPAPAPTVVPPALTVIAHATAKRKWVVLPMTLGICSYKVPKGATSCISEFLCFSLICSNIGTGSVYSQVFGERKICGRFGWFGLFLVVLLLPLFFYSPFGGLVVFGLLANFLRMKVVKKYNVLDENECCCGPLNPLVNFLHNAISYPCSLYQMKMSMNEWDEEVGDDTQVVATVLSPVA
ncbi:hypothetical protein B484DRAFT_455878 [Ochromonadaceae sp. CCMP2298]|nr:hypothetical protein B484DRAFT_455878 [Ochromonadaceae sp. CCMP2298]